MRVLWFLPLFAVAGWAADDPFQLLQAIGRNVVQQISKTSNYTCLETLERSFYKNNGFDMAMHGPAGVTTSKNELLYDRLKLDVAVSEGKEIYAWHGSNKFGASEVTDVVRHGPISTGQFIGYLRNVFLAQAVKFTYDGMSAEGGAEVYRFNFIVPEGATRYNIQTKTGHATVPFHGWLTAKASDLEIASLEVTPEKLPFDSPILSAKTDLTYQMARISGSDALIPSSFVLQIEDENHVFTVSKGNYSQCHEYGSESTLHFDLASDSQGATASAPLPEKTLPAGLNLHLELTSDIDDKTAYTGNPIEAVLIDPVQVDGATIPKGAKLTGVITMFQERFEPERNYFVKMEFHHLAAPNANYTLRSLHEPTGKETEDLYFLYGGYLPNDVVAEIRNGVIIFDSKHVRLRRGFRGMWRTVAEPAQTASASH